MSDVQTAVARLKDEQVLMVLNSLAGEFAEPDMPEGRADQLAALRAAFAQTGVHSDPAAVEGADTAKAAKAGRELLVLLAQDPEGATALQQWLDHPPEQETASAALLLALPIVLTGCIAVLYVLGRVRFKRDTDGKWTIAYDGRDPSVLDKELKKLTGTIADVMKSVQ